MVLRSRRTDRDGSFSGNRVERAIIDIGSNTVRLVVYGGSPRAPVTVFNEKVVARLGRDIADSGRLADEAVDLALRGLRRFAVLLNELNIERVDVVATAAAREAENGPEFLAAIREFGLEPRLLSGEDEARISAMGAIGAFPGVDGIVADLGGGSLELVGVADDTPQSSCSLPLGTLRLANFRGENSDEMRRNLDSAINQIGWLGGKTPTLTLVGGTWRAMAAVAMELQKYPLTDPHGFTLSSGEVRALARRLSVASKGDLSQFTRLSSMRANYLSDAGVLLGVLLDRIKPREVTFSSWGLREGILFDELDHSAKAQDPLLAGVGEFASLRGTPPLLATRVAAWTVGALPAGSEGSERVRLAATMLALASMQIEPNLRTEIAMDWALQKRWINVDACGRAMMAAAVSANKRECDVPDTLRELATEEQIEEAIRWGLAIRLCRRLGGRSNRIFNASSLSIDAGKLVLAIDEELSGLYGEPTQKDLDLLADRLNLEADVRIR